MECWGLSNHKSWSYWSLMLMMIHMLMVGQTQGDCIEEERKALLQIKSSHINSFHSKILPTWVDYGNSTPGDDSGDCCDWERVSCNTTTGHVTDLSLDNLRGLPDLMEHGSKFWQLDVSLFLHFKELRNLSLSYDFLDKEIMKTGLEKLSSLKKLEVLDLSFNKDIDNDILPSLSTLTSLKILDLSDTSLNGNFPANELSHLTNLEELYLASSRINGTPDIQGCKSLSRLKRLKSIDLSYNRFKKSIISCLTSLPSLKILYLSFSLWGSFFPVQEFIDLSDLEVLILSDNGFNGTLPMEAFTSFHQLRVLDLGGNDFVGSIPPAIQALSSLQALSFASNKLSGSLSNHGLCELKNLHELHLSDNMLDGTLPQCLENLSFLKLLDISSNQFTGKLVPLLIANLTSLEYVDFSHNKFEGSFSFSSFSNHTKLELVDFRSNNDKFEVETEEPIDWIPMFQLKVLVLPSCNINRPTGHVVPGFLLYQHKLQELDMSHNSMEGHFPNWLIKNNTNLELLNLRNNSLNGSMLLYWNPNMKRLDVSGNQIIGSIPQDIPRIFPNVINLNLSKNILSGPIPSSIGDLSRLETLDLSDNELSGEVPLGLFTNISGLRILKLSKNKLYGDVLSGNLSFNHMERVHLDSNNFTGKIAIMSSENKIESLNLLDISNNFFTGMIPDWIDNMSGLREFVVRNNSFQGTFPCGTAPRFSFLDISQNYFSGPIPSCSNLQYVRHLHLGSNRFTGSIPDFFCTLTEILTLDMGNNSLSGMIPEFFGELSQLRILLLRKNNFSGSIPKQLCKLSTASFIDLSSNSLSGSIPSCLHNIIVPTDFSFLQIDSSQYHMYSTYVYGSALFYSVSNDYIIETFATRDEVQITTKGMSRPYKGYILDYMSGLDLSCNKLTGEIPEELGLMTQLHALNLSHNQLTGPIPINFSNLVNLESLDLSSNGLSGKVPSELSKMTFLEVLDVSHNNLSGRLPDMNQFGTFTNKSYEGNPLLCGPLLENKCMTEPHVTDPSLEEEGNEKWYDVDMTCFYGSSISTLVVFLLGFVSLLYINPYWRRWWLDSVEECMYKCIYFFHDSVRKLCMIFRK